VDEPSLLVLPLGFRVSFNTPFDIIILIKV
jgi:hypothetical protein